jgi:pimeloyl-ACP methyl ester carboxylesterase
MKKSKSILTTTMVAGALAMQSMVSNAQSKPSDNQESRVAIRPFKVHIPQKDLTDLKNRIKTARWPDQEIVADQTQGVQLAAMHKLADYWLKNYDWRKTEAKLNALPQFVTNIDGVDIYFIHVRSKHSNALPLIMTHGWPGSIFECLDVIGPLTDPTAYGGKAEDAFDIVIPSMPGYGFSGKPTEIGWNSDRIARAWDTLMQRLGYTRYVSQGGDWGARISESLAHLAPKGLLGIHMNFLLSIPPEVLRATALGEPAPAGFSAEEKLAYDQRKSRTLGYFTEQATRPQTIGFSLSETPIGLAAWLLDHDAHSYEQMVKAINGNPDGRLTLDAILNDITLYWLTNSGTSAARLYWEEARRVPKGPVSVPTAFTVFPGETPQAPRSWVEKTFTNLIYFHKADRGGHFAGWEEPQLMAEELRAAFKSLR